MFSSREEQCEAERRYQGDVTYAVWRSGGDVDAIDRDRVSDDYHAGQSAEESAARYRRRCHVEVEYEQQWPEEQWPEQDRPGEEPTP